MRGQRARRRPAALGTDGTLDGYRDDILRCLGLDGRASTIDDILAARKRLAFGTLDLLAKNADRFSPLLHPYLL